MEGARVPLFFCIMTKILVNVCCSGDKNSEDTIIKEQFDDRDVEEEKLREIVTFAYKFSKMFITAIV